MSIERLRWVPQKSTEHDATRSSRPCRLQENDRWRDGVERHVTLVWSLRSRPLPYLICYPPPPAQIQTSKLAHAQDAGNKKRFFNWAPQPHIQSVLLEHTSTTRIYIYEPSHPSTMSRAINVNDTIMSRAVRYNDAIMPHAGDAGEPVTKRPKLAHTILDAHSDEADEEERTMRTMSATTSPASTTNTTPPLPDAVLPRTSPKVPFRTRASWTHLPPNVVRSILDRIRPEHFLVDTPLSLLFARHSLGFPWNLPVPTSEEVRHAWLVSNVVRAGGVEEDQAREAMRNVQDVLLRRSAWTIAFSRWTERMRLVAGLGPIWYEVVRMQSSLWNEVLVHWSLACSASSSSSCPVSVPTADAYTQTVATLEQTCIACLNTSPAQQRQSPFSSVVHSVPSLLGRTRLCHVHLTTCSLCLQSNHVLSVYTAITVPEGIPAEERRQYNLCIACRTHTLRTPLLQALGSIVPSTWSVTDMNWY